ncbi:hypothetical protein GE061_012618 [Apolygus lucorum]|uniref:Ig-like domain-containing protein n=1 Tax=Apolygus lucorum TaxID=248454 RepID=A0A8S9XV35_APOLU|nr:hypothetical protein GE061_012618 [Apolygus lucorum]
MKNAQFTGTQNEYLYINSSITSHTGQYKCVARNRNEEQSRLFSISVAAIPKLTGERTVTKFVDFGEPFQLTCQVEGEPDIVYQWFISKDGKKRRLSTGNKVMQFSSSSFADKASYECTATSSTGFAQQEFIVNIVVAPRLKGEPNQTIQFFSGETLELECLAEEDTVFMVNWAKGGIKLMGTERLSMIPEGSFGDIMRITNASELDAGDYECTAHNEAGGKDQKNFFLQHIDVIPNSKSVIYFALGEPLKLPCKLANGDSYSKIVWMKNGSVLRRPSLRGNDFYKLETHEGDEGLYECILTRKSDIKLIFEAKMLIPPKMRPTRTKRALEVNLGDDLVMECAAEGDPSPTFYWTKNDEEILSGRDSFLTSSSPNGSSSRLSKRNVSNTDGGRYVCHAWNQIGESYKSDRTFYDVIVVGNSKDDPYSGVTQISPQLNFPFEISCPFYESRPDRVLWKKGGYLWTESNMKSNGFRLTSEDGYSTLRTNSANPNHGDVYVCSGESKKEHTFVVNVSVPMYYKDWTEWSDCSASCGGGIKKRERLCQASVKYQPEDIVTLVQSTCVGHNLVQNQTCNPSPCPVDGGWGEWREGACSRSCGGGVRKRRRLCDNPSPSSGGKTCSGSHEDEIRCGDVPCPVDGGWSDWTKWSGCSSSCGFGWKQRYRFCDRPKPSQGGRPCDGEATDQRRCDLPPCEAKRIGDETALSNKKWIWSEWEVSEDCPPGCDQKKILKKVGRCIGTGCKQLEKTREKSEPCPQPPGCE